jgi:alpha-beta hydrolase superfamily lysophospholipase
VKPTYTVRTDDGCSLGVAVGEPTGPVRGEVLLLHAMMVDARALDRPPGGGLASTLVAAGYRVHRADLRGRGMSDRPADWTYDDLVYRDLPALVGAIGGCPWVVGHSLGGHVAAASWASGAVRLRGLVGLGANVWMPSLEPDLRRRISKAAGMGLASLSVGLFGGLAARRARLGPVDEAEGYARDLVRFWLDDRWADRAGRDWSVALRTLDGPVLSVISRGDRLFAHPVGARAWIRAAGPRAEVWELQDGDHGLAKAPDHMGLACDGRSLPVWEAIGAWMTAHDAARA